ncbi:hypothetical protein R5R35_003062 [Gryllus longicercus]|uniref:Apoptosis regulatory protein Siva n=1 Tax=Gryllus longicercus TaxID=2509291 RepID=A0AAN9Z222_9ORTH
MPKRECPFDYDLLPQCKIHVGEKEINSGVMEEHNMKTVYERTMDLLFRRAKNVSNSIENREECATNSNSKLYKQMFLKSNGQLQSSGILLSQPLSECDSCKTPVKLCSSVSCDFCDRRLCPNCMYACTKCMDNFCSHCILKTYSGSGDAQVCISCVP